MVDSSVIISYLMVDEKTNPVHDQVISDHLHHQVTLCAPPILPFEIGNALKSATLSKRLTPKQASALYKDFFYLEINLKPINFQATLALSASLNLSFYDAAYLSLSTKLKSPLITLDKKLAKITL